ncbi:MAG: hypothetical protein ACP5N1_01655 [Candidatus Woesearchaeota archaeon]
MKIYKNNKAMTTELIIALIIMAIIIVAFTIYALRSSEFMNSLLG